MGVSKVYSVEYLKGKTCTCGAFVKVVAGSGNIAITRSMLYCTGCEKQIDECKCSKFSYQKVNLIGDETDVSGMKEI